MVFPLKAAHLSQLHSPAGLWSQTAFCSNKNTDEESIIFMAMHRGQRKKHFSTANQARLYPRFEHLRHQLRLPPELTIFYDSNDYQRFSPMIPPSRSKSLYLVTFQTP